jgi:hypothetical protein
VVRSTWGQDVLGADLRFFIGYPPENSDEIQVDSPDDLQGLTHKVVEAFKWALDQGYDYAFKADLDCFVRPLLLMQSGFEAYDWVGGANSFFASGGAGYMLSRKAMQFVVDFPIATKQEEDVHVARALLAQGIQLHHDPRFLFIPGETLRENTITYHLSSVKAWDAKATPADMFAAYSGTFKLPQQEEPVRRWLRRRV